jgi:hypothetical protein
LAVARREVILTGRRRSGLATAKNLFNLKSFLTKRDAWAGTFESLLTLDEPRTDCPLHLPEGPPVCRKYC